MPSSQLNNMFCLIANLNFILSPSQLNNMFCLIANLNFILPPPQLNNMFCVIANQEPAKPVVVFTSVISLLHAVVNPPLYGWMSQRYRRGYLFVFKTALSICGGKRPNRRSLSKFCSPVKSVKGRTIIFMEGGMRNIQKTVCRA